jgi:hypothetical protein
MNTFCDVSASGCHPGTPEVWKGIASQLVVPEYCSIETAGVALEY